MVAPALPSLKGHIATSINQDLAHVDFRSSAVHDCLGPFEQWMAGDITGSVYGSLSQQSWAGLSSSCVSIPHASVSAALCPAELPIFQLARCAYPLYSPYYIWEERREAGKSTGFSPNKAVMVNLDREAAGEGPGIAAKIHLQACLWEYLQRGWAEVRRSTLLVGCTMPWWAEVLDWHLRMWVEHSPLCFLTMVIMRPAASVLLPCCPPWWTVPSNH